MNPWVIFVKEFSRIHNMVYSDALKYAKGPYNRGEGPASTNF